MPSPRGTHEGELRQFGGCVQKVDTARAKKWFRKCPKALCGTKHYVMDMVCQCVCGGLLV